MIRIAFDIGGVISKYPKLFKQLIEAINQDKIELFILTDMHPKDKVKETLWNNGFGFEDENILVADYAKYGEAAKAVLCKENAIDIFIDDFIGYVADPGATIRLLVMPDSKLPYWSETWKVTDNHDFGRRYNKE